MTKHAEAPSETKTHYPSRVLLNIDVALTGVATLVLALNLFGAKGLLSVPLTTSFWLGGSAFALIVAGFVWRSRVRT